MVKILKAWKIILIVILLFLFFSPINKNFAQTPTSVQDTISEELQKKKEEIKNLEKKVFELQKQENTFTSQIAVMDSQIRLTQLKINAVKQEIIVLEEDIDIANRKISNLENSLNALTNALVNRIVATYEFGSVQPLQIFLTSDNATDFFTKANYLRIVQAHDKKMIFEVQQTKDDYANQKEIFEDKKIKIETLKKQLEDYTSQLDQEKIAKQQLLEITRNDERKYQELLNNARREVAAIEGVVSTLKLQNGTPIREGQTIAVVGNSGYPNCSTGPHLHFEVRKNEIVENPSNYLKSGISFTYSYLLDKYDYFGTINPSGDWNWPLDNPIIINQGYGSHAFAKSFYPNGFHSGIDMESDSSSLIKAPKDGTLYKGTTSCGGAGLNYAAIDHGNGVISWYWHVR